MSLLLLLLPFLVLAVIAPIAGVDSRETVRREVWLRDKLWSRDG